MMVAQVLLYGIVPHPSSKFLLCRYHAMRVLALEYSSYITSPVDATHSKYLLTNVLLSRLNYDVYLTACYTLYTEGVQI